MGVVEEETDETMYWMELLIKCGLVCNDMSLSYEVKQIKFLR